MNILLCGNDGVTNGINLAVYSILYNNHTEPIHFYIFTMDIDVEVDPREGKWCHYTGITPEHQRLLKKIVKYLSPNSTIEFIDVHDHYLKYLDNSVNKDTGFTPYAGLRLIVDKVLPHINYLLYLDCDTACCGDIYEMYHKCMNDKKTHYYAAFNNDIDDGEMVSGVMMMNIKLMKETGFLDRALELYNKHCYTYPDQYALRDAKGTVKQLPDTFVYMKNLLTCYTNPSIIHFTYELVDYKIYGTGIGPYQFYKLFPQFQYVKDGLELVNHLDIVV